MRPVSLGHVGQGSPVHASASSRVGVPWQKYVLGASVTLALLPNPAELIQARGRGANSRLVKARELDHARPAWPDRIALDGVRGQDEENSKLCLAEPLLSDEFGRDAEIPLALVKPTGDGRFLRLGHLCYS